MNIVEKNIKDIIPYNDNPRFNDEAVEYVANSIKEFGFKVPVIIDKNNVVVAGHTRLKACERLGITNIPCIVADDLNEDQIKAFRLADNKVSEIAEWDMDKLLGELSSIELDMEQFGFDDLIDDEIDTADIEEDDFSDEVNDYAKRGDLFILGNHRLLCGDSTSEKDVATLMGGAKADMVFTDPPYGMHLDTDWSGAKSKLQFYKEKGCKGQGNKYDKIIGDNDDFKDELITTIFDNFNYCKEIFIWGGDYYPELLKDYKQGNYIVWDKRSNEDTNPDFVSQSDKMFGSCFELCWSKNKHRKEIIRVKWAGIFGTEKEFDKKRVHPTQKPTKLSSTFIEKYSSVNNVIVDLYGGSGSTLIASEILNRKCYMMELDTHYIDVIVNRYINKVGNKDNCYLIRDGVKTPLSEIEAYEI